MDDGVRCKAGGVGALEEEVFPKTGDGTVGLAARVAHGVRAYIEDAVRAEGYLSPEESRRHGKALRKQVARSSHAAWEASTDRPDPVELLREQGRSRVRELLPIRYERMAASPFAFYRGAALVMASDLSRTPRTGIVVQACGDAHICNFGLFSSPERRTVFDINDFDETLPGPWEWDVKRLAASVEILGRQRNLTEQERTGLVLACVRAYREGMRSFAGMGNLDVWYAHLDVDDLQASLEASQAPKREVAAVDKVVERAKAKDSSRAVARLTEVVGGQLRVVSNPPTVVPLRDLADESGRVRSKDHGSVDMTKVIARILAGYRMTLAPERRRLVEEYRGVDIARKVVGVGSVGTRSWIVVMRGASDGDPLVLQVKEAQASVLERFVGKGVYVQQGQRVVEGQRAMQTASDILLGWCRLPGEDGRHKDYYVRQLWDGKGSVDVERLPLRGLMGLVRACGWTLAHAHARTGDRFAIAGYLGKGDAFDRAVARFAAAYADQNEADYQRFLTALDAGELPRESA